jgi:F-type H+-transporting ATPase subunit b
MQLDWFTVVAQIINFLVLIALLKRFLYGPIIRAMDEREERIAQQMREAEERERQAEERAGSYREKQQELEEKRSEILGEVREEAETKRREMVQKARDEVDELRQRWCESLRRDKGSFIADMRQQAGREICTVTRRVLRDLAGERLEARMVAAFLERLGHMDDEDRNHMSQAADESGAVVVLTSFALPEAARRKVRAGIRQHLSQNAEVQFETAEELICGIEVRAGGRKLAWTVARYLDALSESLAQALSREAGEGDGD